jgi:hypothetical protein
MFNVKDKKWAPGFRVELPSDPQNSHPLADNSSVDNPYFPGLARASELFAFRIPTLPNINLPALPAPLDDDPEESIQPVRKPIKCSGPNSKCSLPLKIRANGVFRDPRYPQFLLCRPCYISAYGRTPTGEDT